MGRGMGRGNEALQSQITTNGGFITSLNSTSTNLQTQITSNDTDILNNYNTLDAVDISLQNQITSNDTDILNNYNALNTVDISLQNQISSNDTDILDTKNDLIAFPTDTTFTGTTIINKIELPSDTVDKECLMYYDNTNDCTMINSIHHGVNGKPICLNTIYGGDIIIGTNSKLILGDEIDLNNATITNFNKSDINLDLVTNQSNDDSNFTGDTTVENIICDDIITNPFPIPVFSMPQQTVPSQLNAWSNLGTFILNGDSSYKNIESLLKLSISVNNYSGTTATITQFRINIFDDLTNQLLATYDLFPVSFDIADGFVGIYNKCNYSKYNKFNNWNRLQN